MELTHEYLQHLLHYDPLTGLWTWINPLSTKYRRGDSAGSIDAKGYLCIKTGGKSYKSSRLAFLYMTGAWPKDEMDHINRIQSDDRWENLREANRSLNTLNRDFAHSEWRCIAMHFNKYKVTVGRTYLGLFDTFEEAQKVRDEALARFTLIAKEAS